MSVPPFSVSVWLVSVSVKTGSELLAEVALEGGVTGGGFEGPDVLVRQAVHDAAVQADFCRGAWCGA